MLYNVNELSTLFKVSKVTVYKKLDTVKDLKQFIKVKNKVKYLSEEGLEILSRQFSNKEFNTTDSPEDKNNIETLLKSQVEYLQEQLKEKDKQLERMQVLLLNNQKLLETRQDKPHWNIWKIFTKNNT